MMVSVLKRLTNVSRMENIKFDAYIHCIEADLYEHFCGNLNEHIRQ